MSGRLSLADLRRRRLAAGTGDDGTPLLDPSAASQGRLAPIPTPTSTDKATVDGTVTRWAVSQELSPTGYLDAFLDDGCLPRFEGEPHRKVPLGRAVGSRWFEALPAQKKEEIHEDAIVHMHYLMNPNRRASRYYVAADGKRKKRLEVDYLCEESGILQAIRRSGEARIWLWYALYVLIFRLWMSTFLLLADIILDPREALKECGPNHHCGPQRDGSTYALWVYMANNSVAWLICLVATVLLPQYDERFNIFHVRITQLCMIVLFSLGFLTLSFEYFTYDGSKLRRIYEIVNMVLTIVIYVLCKISTSITALEMTALGESIANQRDHSKRYLEMAEEWSKFVQTTREAIQEKEEADVWNKQPGGQLARPMIPLVKKE